MPPRSDMNTGILLVAPSGGEPAADAALAGLEARVRRRFPGAEVRWAYSAAPVRRRLAALGRPAAAPAAALRALRRAGCKRAAVASLHVAAGLEYDRLRAELEPFRHGRRAFEQLVLCPPLLGSAAELQRVVRALLAAVPPARRRNEAVLFMGHGNARHPGALTYLAAAAEFQRRDRRAFLATLESPPRLRDVLPLLRAAGVRRAYLLPFMALAGYHVHRDMAGAGQTSWARQLTRAGIAPVAVCRGLFEYPAVIALWLKHLDEAGRR